MCTLTLQGSGDDFTCILSTDQEIKCFGGNDDGQLGQENTKDIGDNSNEMGCQLDEVELCSDFIPIQISVGARHVCALSTNFTVKCWGANEYGQLGLGHTDTIGDDNNEMGCDLAEVELPDDFVPIEVIAGTNHTCAISSNRSMVCWGSNEYGECGVGNCTDSMDRIGDESDEMGNYMTLVDVGDDFIIDDAKCSNGFTCVLGIDGNLGEIKCFGLNDNGQLGYGDTDNRGCDEDDLGDNLEEVDLGQGYNVTQLPTGSGGMLTMFHVLVCSL